MRTISAGKKDIQIRIESPAGTNRMELWAAIT